METEKICPDSCILCNRKFDWGEVIIIKAPVFICFCMKCADDPKYNDPNIYNNPHEQFITHIFHGKEMFEFTNQ